ncbi:hypothetical protein Cylst_3087 [Cylindrospermum stagnale PCC 7417]|uniref:GmrSD restriction endonucleases N-terminal domain-containing protein n=1 Tax=Cylindrospermum stagnale PCC 7417 TaxID=56107 RepID=K9X0G4_9NOST|nr:DUF262 domain-containing protein [Cylindrospermum stagnale]AFZ25257.1 hypothetical protein Cylst_3087 [Cylindrospermum stagnale PCC 7417]
MDSNYSFDEEQSRFDDYADEEDDFQIDEYDLTSTPNDFNVITIYNFMESGAVKIPGFQRNYVWDINRASKLIESIILGLPIPQIFLYEESRNKFLIIDGQQRLMSIYYFMKRRFPLKDKRVELRRIFEINSCIPDEILNNDKYFSNFDLSLPQKLPEQPNKFKGLNYFTLGDYKTQFELRPIRNVIVKQNSPKDDDSSIYEIFNRLNSGGVNLTPQEIRASLYHSPFYEMLNRINMERGWRNLLQMDEPDIHMKDVELLLRAFAMLIDEEEYAPSLPKFLNRFSKKSRKNSQELNNYLENLFKTFLKQCEYLEQDPFIGNRNKRFHIALFEAVFTAVCKPIFLQRQLLDSPLEISKIRQIENDTKFVKASSEGTTKKSNVEIRLQRAKEILGV